MKKSKYVIVAVLAVILCVMTFTTQSLSWFSYLSDSGDSLAFTATGIYANAAGGALTMQTFLTDENGTVTDDAAITNINKNINASDTQYFKTVINNSAESKLQYANLFLGKVTTDNPSSDIIYLGVKDPLKSYKHIYLEAGSVPVTETQETTQESTIPSKEPVLITFADTTYNFRFSNQYAGRNGTPAAVNVTAGGATIAMTNNGVGYWQAYIPASSTSVVFSTGSYRWSTTLPESGTRVYAVKDSNNGYWGVDPTVFLNVDSAVTALDVSAYKSNGVIIRYSAQIVDINNWHWPNMYLVSRNPDGSITYALETEIESLQVHFTRGSSNYQTNGWNWGDSYFRQAADYFVLNDSNNSFFVGGDISGTDKRFSEYGAYNRIDTLPTIATAGEVPISTEPTEASTTAAVPPSTIVKSSEDVPIVLSIPIKKGESRTVYWYIKNDGANDTTVICPRIYLSM